ncbi:MAG TPA: flagellar basal body L-ring protein FlgH [bacterium]|nr:flagellar basal body L-ring protein FlgH [bacterium]
MSHPKWFLLTIVALAALLAGCVTAKPAATQPVQGYQALDFAQPYQPQDQPAVEGQASLWPGSMGRNLVADHRAGRINDIITVSIVEDASATGKANTKTSRDSTIGMGVSGMFGMEQSLARSNPNMNLDTLVGAKTANSFTGDGETTRSTKVVATISCTIVETFANGNMRVNGKRMIKVNGEDQVITLTGIVRPEDIDNENTIESTRIVDARITYDGIGVIADKQKAGWFTRVLDNVWPF